MPTVENLGIPSVPPLIVDQSGVHKLLPNLEDCKAPGPDGIFPSILKNCSDSIAPLLSKIYQASVDPAYLPRDWRMANITPIFKRGDRQNPANYRLVSLTSIFADDCLVYRIINSPKDCIELQKDLSLLFDWENE